DPDLDVVRRHHDVDPEPFSIVDDLLVDVAYPVKGSGAFALPVIPFAESAVVDLNLEALLGESFSLKSCVEVNAGISERTRHNLSFQLEILDAVVAWTVIKQVRRRPVREDLLAFEAPGTGEVGFPLSEGRPLVDCLGQRGGG